MIRILHLESPNKGRQGDHIYRTLQPCRALAQLDGVEVVSGSLLSPNIHPLLLEADILVLCDVVDVDLISVMEKRNASGLLTVYEVNDHYLSPQPWNPIAYLSDNLLTRSLSSLLAHLSDGVQFTVDELAKDFGHLNSRKAVFHNQLWQVPSFRERPQSGTLRIGWGGSLGHKEDLLWVMPALENLLKAYPFVQLSIMGPEELSALFSWAKAGRVVFRPGGSIEEYYDFLNTLDIGLCPNLPTDFNRCRSDVKFLEYAAHGVVAVCSDIAPYRHSVTPGETGFLFSSPIELETQLRSLVENEALRKNIAHAAFQKTALTRIESQKATHRLEQYAEWAQEAGKPWPPPNKNTPLSQPYSFDDARYLRLGEGEVENPMYLGLRRVQAGDVAHAIEAFSLAAESAPSFYLPFLLRGAVDPDTEKALASLRIAAQLKPDSAHVAMTTAQKLEEIHRPEEALEEWQRCISLSPQLGLGHARLGAMSEKEGDIATAIDFYVQAFSRNPFFAPPLVRLAEKALENKDFALVEGLMTQAMSCDAFLWHYPYYLGRCLLLANRPREAHEALEKALSLTFEPEIVLPHLAKASLALKDVVSAQRWLAQLKEMHSSR